MADIITRVRTILGWLKDDSETLIDPSISEEIADAVILTYFSHMLFDADGNPIDIADVPAAAKARAVRNHLRNHLQQVVSAVRVPAAGETARQSESASIDSDLATKLGPQQE